VGSRAVGDGVFALWRAGEEIFGLGADDYLDKGTKPKILRMKALALWRRIKMTRTNANKRFVHTNRVFRIRDWRFVVGDRRLTNCANVTIRLSPTEHAFFCYLCTVDDHQIDRQEFNIGVLGRPAHLKDMRIDNLVYQINRKLGTCVQNTSKEDGTYKLLDIKELRAT
jgi:DNA-binding response OmpR family regulator